MLRFQPETQIPFITTPERIGHAKGYKRGLREAIILGLELRYGAAGLALGPAVQRVTELVQLETILAKIKAAAPLTELQALLPTS